MVVLFCRYDVCIDRSEAKQKTRNSKMITAGRFYFKIYT